MPRALMLLLAAVAISSCAAAPPAKPTPVERPPYRLTATVLGPEQLARLAPHLPPGANLADRSLLLAGGSLPANVSTVRIQEVVEGVLVGHSIATSGGHPLEHVDVLLSGGRLRVAFVHEPTTSGWCCAGTVDMRPRDPRCRAQPPMPATPSPTMPAAVFLYRVPRTIAERPDRIEVVRATGLCARQ